MIVNKATDTAFGLMGKTVAVDKDLQETREALLQEVTSGFGALIEKYEELSFHLPPLAGVSAILAIDKAMELGMKVGTFVATTTIDAREKVKEKLKQKLKETAKEKGYLMYS